MDKINGVNQYQKTPEQVQAQQADKTVAKVQENKEGMLGETKTLQGQQEAVVYEKSNPLEGISTYDRKGKKLDAETIEKMKNEAEMHYARMIETVKQMIAKQSKEAGGVPKEFDFFNRIPKSVAELNATNGFQKNDGIEDHIGEDLNDPNSYWSAEKTAERIVDFAKKISGGDTKKYETLKNAIEKGFSAASSYFDKMPDITGKTYDLVMKGLDQWAGKAEEEKDPKKEAKTTQAAAL